MCMLPALRKLLPLAAALSLVAGDASAGPRNGVGVQAPEGGYVVRERRVWGPAKMPPAPRDFGPHFDFPPEPLNGGLTHDPYPN